MCVLAVCGGVYREYGYTYTHTYIIVWVLCIVGDPHTTPESLQYGTSEEHVQLTLSDRQLFNTYFVLGISEGYAKLGLILRCSHRTSHFHSFSKLPSFFSLNG